MAEHPDFLIDRSLGRKHLASALSGLGLTVHTLASVYGEAASQELDHESWLADAGANDWIVLMKDARSAPGRPSGTRSRTPACVRSASRTPSYARPSRRPASSTTSTAS